MDIPLQGIDVERSVAEGALDDGGGKRSVPFAADLLPIHRFQVAVDGKKLSCPGAPHDELAAIEDRLLDKHFRHVGEKVLLRLHVLEHLEDDRVVADGPLEKVPLKEEGLCAEITRRHHATPMRSPILFVSAFIKFASPRRIILRRRGRLRGSR